MVNVCVHGRFGSNGFVIKVQPFSIDGHYKIDIIPEVGLNRATNVMYGSHAISRALVLYNRSLGTASTLLRVGNIFGRPYG